MSNLINIMERFNTIVKDLKNEGLYVEAKIKIIDNEIVSTSQGISLKIEADNLPR